MSFESQATDILVIGAGMVGASAALHLRMRGRDVLLVDRRQPGSETSYGNAGVIAGSAHFQAAVPRNIMEIARLALNRTTYFRYNPAVLPKLAPWLWRFWWESSVQRLDQTAHRSQALFWHAVREHVHLAQHARALHLLKHTGWLHITRKREGLAALSRDRRLADELGVSYSALTAEDIRDLEPSLDKVSAGIHWHDVYHTCEPQRLTKAYVAAFIAGGGRFEEVSVQALGYGGVDGWTVRTSGHDIKAKEVVIATGPWSRDLFSPLGYRLPLESKRGYHQHFAPSQGARLGRPVKDSDYGFVLAPMQDGIRLTTGVEFDWDDAPLSYKQLGRVLPRARELFPLGQAISHGAWLGRRPAFPDQLPMIGAASRHHGLWFNFGHAHWGLTLGPSSGRLLAEMICKESLSVDPRLVSPERSF